MSSRSLDLCPAFFKVYMPEFCSRHLQIPVAFERHIRGNLPQTSTIRCRGGMRWDVKIARDENGLFFKKGWSKLVQDCAFKLGEFLVFYYVESNSSFFVKFFGRSFCEKKITPNAVAYPLQPATFPSHKQAEVKQETPSDEEDTCGDNVNRPPISIIQHDKLSGSNCIGRQSRNCKREADENRGYTKASIASRTRSGRPAGSAAGRPVGKASAAEEAANQYIPKHPSFRAVLNETYVAKGRFLHIPREFYRTYMKREMYRKKDNSVELQTRRKSWQVHAYICSIFCRLNVGWRDFVRDNGLRAGDVCVFELVKLRNIVFKVSIFRSGER